MARLRLDGFCNVRSQSSGSNPFSPWHKNSFEEKLTLLRFFKVPSICTTRLVFDQKKKNVGAGDCITGRGGWVRCVRSCAQRKMLLSWSLDTVWPHTGLERVTALVPSTGSCMPLVLNEEIVFVVVVYLGGWVACMWLGEGDFFLGEVWWANERRERTCDV